MGWAPPGPTHGKRRLQSHPGAVLKSTPNVRKSPRSGLNLEGRLSDPQFLIARERPPARLSTMLTYAYRPVNEARRVAAGSVSLARLSAPSSGPRACRRTEPLCSSAASHCTVAKTDPSVLLLSSPDACRSVEESHRVAAALTSPARLSAPPSGPRARRRTRLVCDSVAILGTAAR